jgi:pyruvate dehydrogenase E2 component (dihydrolipoamide acetyltransferase)
LAEASEILLEEQKTKKLPTEMEGSTFTVSNLGMFGIVEFYHQSTQFCYPISRTIVEKPV